MKLKTYAEKLGYFEIHVFKNGKDGVKGCKKLFSDNLTLVVLLFDTGLPDLEGDIVATGYLMKKLIYKYSNHCR